METVNNISASPNKWNEKVIFEHDIKVVIGLKPNNKSRLEERDRITDKEFGKPIFGRPGRPEEAYLPS